MTVKRSTKATEETQKGTEPPVKEISATLLESCITWGNGNEKTVKGAEFEQEMETALGVSKPVLDNVVFCPQEDACWPLSESSTLKKKFDLIFNSERYNSRLKAILDVKTQKERILETAEEDIKWYKKHKEEACAVEKHLKEQEALLVNTMEESKRLEKERADNKKQITATEEKEKEVQKKQNTLEKKKTLKEEKENSIEDLLAKMGPVLQDTDEELEKRQSDFACEIQECEESKVKFERRSKDLAAKQETLSSEKSSLLIDVGKLEQEAETHKKKVDDRNAKVCDWAKKYGFKDLEQGSITDEICDTFLERMRQERETKDEEYRKKEGDFQNKKEELQGEIKAASKRKEELEQCCKEGGKNVDIVQIKQKLSHLKATAEQQPLLTQKLHKAEQVLYMAERSVVLDDLKREITRLDEEQCQLDNHRIKLKSERNRLTMLEEIHEIEQSKRKEDEVKGQKREATVSGNHTFDNCLQDAWKTLSDIQEERGSLLGKKRFFQEYLDDLSRDIPVCHFCDRSFENAREADLKSDLENQLQLIGTELLKTEKELANHQKRYEDIVLLRPIREKLVTIQEQGLPDLQSFQEKISEGIHHLKDWIEKKQGELTLETSESMGREMQPGIVLIDAYQEELRKMEEKMAAHSGGDSTRTLEMVVKEEEELQKRLDAVVQERNQKLQTSDPPGRLEDLRKQVKELQDQKSEIDEELQQQTKLEKTQKDLEELRSLQVKLDEYNSEKEEVVKDMEGVLKPDKDAIEEMKGQERDIAQINKAIREYEERNMQGELAEKRKDLEKLENEETKEKNNQDKLRDEFVKAERGLATQKERQRELSDNQHLRDLQKCVGKVDKEMAELEQQLNALDPKKLEGHLKTLKEEEQKLTDEFQKVQGQQREYETRVEDHRATLQLPNYRDATEELRKKAIELRTTELVIEDLKKYHKALDTAIMNYHTQKMREVNQVIKEQWKNTYQGNDIDVIKIRSNVDGGEKKHKKYNYCVMMVQGDAELEMRGRCSAGQKMLASIIIRLALAETFCMNCGVIALDEPTTNLDRKNFDSLAYTLSCIMKERQGRNFQLLVITHSIEFAERLRRAEMTEFVWKVSKDGEGNSKIERRSIQELEE